LRIKPENRFWIYIYGFTAFILLVAMGVFGWLVWTSKEEPGVGRVAGPHAANPSTVALPDEEYALLSQFPAPPYAQERHEPPMFHSAMALYQKRDYVGAAAALRPVADANPAFAAAKFYLGVSLLLSRNRIGGIQELRDLADRGDSPYLDRARFYLAKGLIAEHDLDRAREQLEKVTARHGDLEKPAAELLNQIRSS
jgi:TolA-binding protein